MSRDYAIIAAFLAGCLTMFILSEYYGRKIRRAEDAVRKHYTREVKGKKEAEEDRKVR